MALLVLPIWVLIKPSQFLKRLGRAAIVGIGGLLIISWVMVPLLMDSKFSTASLYIRNTFWVDSYGARKVLGWLFSGQLFDGSTPSRLPVVSVLVALGAIICISRWRSDERARALLCALALGLVLFSGRPTFGPLTDLIPGSKDLLLHRFIAGVHMAGVLLAGVGVGWIAGVARRLVPRFEQLPQRIGVSAAVVGVAVLALAPAWSERVTFDDFGRQWLNTQRAADAQEGASMDALIAEAKALGPGRIFAGASGGSSYSDRIYSVPIYNYLLSDDADAIGFYLRTTSVSEDVETLFDASNPVDYDIFNVRYVIWPADRRTMVPAKFIDTKGGHSLWRVPTSGYLEVVDALPPITADRTNLAEHVKSWLKSPLPGDGKFPTIAFGGAAGAPATLPPAGPVLGPAGNVDSESDSLQDGVVSGEVTLNRPAMVMLKASFDPRWTVEVDGVQLAPQMVAPSFVGREVPAGSHTVVFRYQPFPRYDVLFALGALVFFGVLLRSQMVAATSAQPRREKEARLTDVTAAFGGWPDAPGDRSQRIHRFAAGRLGGRPRLSGADVDPFGLDGPTLRFRLKIASSAASRAGSPERRWTVSTSSPTVRAPRCRRSGRLARSTWTERCAWLRPPARRASERSCSFRLSPPPRTRHLRTAGPSSRPSGGCLRPRGFGS